MIIIKSPQEIEIMKKGGQILARILNLVTQRVTPGIGTKELNELAEQKIRKAGGFPAFKGYQGFPTGLCTCINSEIVHAPAIPDRKLKEGDIFSIDVGMRWPAKNGMITDVAITVPVGKISPQAQKLIKVTKKTLDVAIKKIKPGAKLGSVSCAIQKYIEKNKFNVVRELVGHGVGKKLHEEPQIPNYGLANTGPMLKPGMTLAIEPMVTAGSFKVNYNRKTQAFSTTDNSLAAHFEHTVLVTEKGSEVLTK